MFSRVPLEDLNLSDAPVYKKTVRVRARRAVAGERLETVLKSGAVETSRVLDGSEWVVTNPDGEEYAMGGEKFAVRYRPTEEDGVFQAVGQIRAIPNPWGTPIVITAPWGEDQFGDELCLVALGSEGEKYLIAYAEFQGTYAPA